MLKKKSEFLKNVEDSPFWVDELAGNLRYFNLTMFGVITI